MRIAAVTGHFPSSGLPTQGRPALETLRIVARSHEVEVFYPHAAYPALLKPHSRIYGGLDHGYAVEGLRAGYYDYPALPALSRPFNGFIAARTLLPHVRGFEPDIVFSYFLYPDGYAGLKIAQALRIPFVGMGVGSDVHSIRDRFTLIHTRAVLRRADYLLAISEDLRRRMIAMGAPESRTRTLVSGCKTSEFHPRDKSGARFALKIGPDAQAVVYIGRMDLKKGLRELVEAAVCIRRQHPRLEVYMVGGGPDRPAVAEAIDAHRAGEFVKMIPECPFDEVPLWMGAADLVTLPSYMEGMPNVVLEALACGRPVVATNVGGIPEVVSVRCGALVAPGDAKSLGEAISATLEQEWSAKAIAAQFGRSWDTVAAELIDLFESAASGRQPR